VASLKLRRETLSPKDTASKPPPIHLTIIAARNTSAAVVIVTGTLKVTAEKGLETIDRVECAIPGRVTMRMKGTLEIINMTGVMEET
jgi:hypothetical protein